MNIKKSKSERFVKSFIEAYKSAINDTKIINIMSNELLDSHGINYSPTPEVTEDMKTLEQYIRNAIQDKNVKFWSEIIWRQNKELAKEITTLKEENERLKAIITEYQTPQRQDPKP